MKIKIKMISERGETGEREAAARRPLIQRWFGKMLLARQGERAATGWVL